MTWLMSVPYYNARTGNLKVFLGVDLAHLALESFETSDNMELSDV